MPARRAAQRAYLPSGFRAYLKLIGSRESNHSALDECVARFVELTGALRARGLRLRVDSRLCEQFIMGGCGSIGAVVDTTEEMAFLFKHTKYSAKCRLLMDAVREDTRGEWYTRQGYRDLMNDLREEAKMLLCVEYLTDSKGLKVPMKWERCRDRFDEVQLAGMSPRDMAHYIYATTRS